MMSVFGDGFYIYRISQVLSLPPFIWKMLNRERLSFEKDYYTVDAAEVSFFIKGVERKSHPRSNLEGEAIQFDTWFITSNVILYSLSLKLNITFYYILISLGATARNLI